MEIYGCLCERVCYITNQLNRLENVIPSDFHIKNYSDLTMELVQIIVPCAKSHICRVEELTFEEEFTIRQKKCWLGKEIQRLQGKIYPEIINFYQKAYQQQYHIERCDQLQQDQEECYYGSLVRDGYLGKDTLITQCNPPGYLDRQGLEDALNWFTIDNNDNIDQPPVEGNTTHPLLASIPSSDGIDLSTVLRDQDQLADTLRWVDSTVVSDNTEFWNHTMPAVEQIHHQIREPDKSWCATPTAERVLDHPRESLPLKIPINPIWKQSIQDCINRRNMLLQCIGSCN